MLRYSDDRSGWLQPWLGALADAHQLMAAPPSLPPPESPSRLSSILQVVGTRVRGPRPHMCTHGPGGPLGCLQNRHPPTPHTAPTFRLPSARRKSIQAAGGGPASGGGGGVNALQSGTLRQLKVTEDGRGRHSQGQPCSVADGG